MAVNTFEVYDCTTVAKKDNYSNYTVNLSKYTKENQEIHFNHHHRA